MRLEAGGLLSLKLRLPLDNRAACYQSFFSLAFFCAPINLTLHSRGALNLQSRLKGKLITHNVADLPLLVILLLHRHWWGKFQVRAKMGTFWRRDHVLCALCRSLECPQLVNRIGCDISKPTVQDFDPRCFDWTGGIPRLLTWSIESILCSS